MLIKNLVLLIKKVNAPLNIIINEKNKSLY